MISLVTLRCFSRSELLDIYRIFAKMVETQFSKPIKAFCSDNALEYTKHGFEAILKTLWHCSSLVVSWHLNGHVERKLRHILDTVHALLISTLVPTLFWGEASHMAVYMINRCLPLSLIFVLLTSGCLALFPHITIFVSLVLHVLFYFNLMSAPNSSLVLDCLVFLDIEWNKKVTGIITLCLIIFASLII
jgi:hypothetical protein